MSSEKRFYIDHYESEFMHGEAITAKIKNGDDGWMYPKAISAGSK